MTEKLTIDVLMAAKACLLENGVAPPFCMIVSEDQIRNNWEDILNDHFPEPEYKTPDEFISACIDRDVFIGGVRVIIQ